MNHWSQQHDISLLYTPIYHPKSNGSVERVHRELNRLIPKALRALGMTIEQWSRCLVFVANLLNSTPHSVTGFAPEVLQKGYLTDEIYLYTANGRHNMQEMWDIARGRLIKASVQREHLPKPPAAAAIEPGTRVRIVIPGRLPVSAKVLIDYGLTCLIEKLEGRNDRFKKLVVSKAHLYLDVEGEEEC